MLLMLRPYLFLLVLALSAISLSAQTIDTATLSLPQVLACPGDTVALPVTVENFRNVRAFQFFLNWNPNQLVFLDTCHAYRAGIFTAPFAPGQLATLLLGGAPGTDTLNNLSDGDTLITFKFRVLDLTNPAAVNFTLMPPNMNSSIITTLTNPLGSAISYRPYTSGGGVSLLALGAQASATPITCAGFGQLLGSAARPGLSYTWLRDTLLYAQVADTITAIGGNYTLAATNGRCLETIPLIVPYDTLPPPPVPIPIDTIDCQTTALSLAPVATNPAFQYNWVRPPQDTVAGATLAVTASGDYTLLTLNPANACRRADTVSIVDITAFPVVSVSVQDTLSCLRDTVMTIAVITDNVGFTTVWLDALGAVVSVSDTLAATAAGLYVLTVTNENNFCATMDTMEVAADLAVPDVTIAGDTALTCLSSLLPLSATTTAQGVVWTWMDDMGNIIGTGPAISRTVAGLVSVTGMNMQNGCVGTATRLIVQDTLSPVVSLAAAADTLTCGLSEIVLAGLGAGPDVSFNWAQDSLPLSTNTAIVVTMPGVYELTATNVLNGCTTTLEVAIAQDTLSPTISVAGGLVLTCDQAGTSLSVQADVPGTCVWNAGAPGCDLTATVAGSYTVLFTSAQNQCAATATVEVTVAADLPPVTAISSGNLGCAATAVTLSADTVYADLTYIWTNSGGDTLALAPTVVVIQGGVYTLTVVDAQTGCSIQDMVEVANITDLPSGVAAISGVLTCSTLAVDLLANQVSANTSVAWQTAQGIPIPNAQASTPGTYILLLTDTLTNCTGIDSIQVVADLALPPAQVNTPQGTVLTCALPAVQLTTEEQAGLSFAWRDATGTLLSSSALLNVEVGGAYTLSVTSLSNGCARDTAVTITEDTASPNATIQLVQGFDCVTGTALLAVPAVEGHTYQWAGAGLASTPANGPTAAILLPGRYDVTVTNSSNGCAETAFLEVSANAGGIQAVGIEVSPTSCGGTDDGRIDIEAVTGGQAPYVFVLDGIGPIEAVGVGGLAAGTYTLIVTDAAGCQLDTNLVVLPSSGHSIAINPASASLSLGDSVLLSALFDVSEANISGVVWQVAGQVVCDSCFSFVASPERSTVYQVQSTDLNGCTATALVEVLVSKAVPVFVPTAFSPNGDGINDRFFPYTGASVVAVRSLRIFDRWGGMVYEQVDLPANVPAEGWDGRMGGRPAAVGAYVYTVELTMANGEQVLVHGEVMLVR